MKREKGIDDIFKHSLQGPANEPEFAEHDWDALENMLDKPVKASKVFWLPYLSAAAAVLLIAFCWWVFKPSGTDVQNAQQVVKTQTKKQVPIIDTVRTHEQRIAISSSKNAEDKNGGSTPAVEHTNKSASPKIDAQQPYVAGSVNKVKRSTSRDFNAIANRYQGSNAPTVLPEADTARPYNIIAAASPTFNIAPDREITKPVLASIGDVTSNQSIRPLNVAKPKITKVSSVAFKPQFALAILAAPELNGIGSLRSAGRGTNVGMMFTVGVGKFSLSTGLNYTVKPYSLPYSQYPSSYSYRATPETVTADCRMLDIPINLGYQVYNKSGNKLTLGTGVSSYIMTHETYTYDYGNAAKVYGPSFYAVPGKGKYPFSIMNVQATYERQINSKFGLSIQPYYKIPLSAIGYSQVRVQTFGLAVGVNWNINQLTKPK